MAKTLSFEECVVQVRVVALQAAAVKAAELREAHGWDASRLLDSARFNDWGRGKKP